MVNAVAGVVKLRLETTFCDIKTRNKTSAIHPVIRNQMIYYCQERKVILFFLITTKLCCVCLYVRPNVHMYISLYVRQSVFFYELLLTYCYSTKNLRNYQTLLFFDIDKIGCLTHIKSVPLSNL